MSILHLLMQWIDGVLCRGDKVDFFHDEFRCPVYVKDVVTIILALINKWISGLKNGILYAFGDLCIYIYRAIPFS